jgi:hypothetical protein
VEQIATITFEDLDSGNQGAFLVRASPRVICLGVTVRTGGDIDVVLCAGAARQLVDALNRAIASSEQ